MVPRRIPGSKFSTFLLICGITAFTTAVGAQGTAGRGNFDGPAELPRVYVKSALADTPAPGRVRTVKAGDNLQEALQSARCGDTLKLEAGATFTGVFRVPNKPCDDGHWIVVRTSAADSELPAEGTRITPCYGGVASLPGRPAYPCDKPKNVLAKIAFEGKRDSGPLILESGANHYRFMALEITRANTDGNVRNLVQPEKDGSVNHIVFDRVWAHGMANGLDAVLDAVVDFLPAPTDVPAVEGMNPDKDEREARPADDKAPFRLNELVYAAGGEDQMIIRNYYTMKPTELDVTGQSGARVIENIRTPFGHRIKIEARAKNVPLIESEITIYDAIKRIDIKNHIRKEDIRAKEAIYFAFPFRTVSGHTPCPDHVTLRRRLVLTGRFILGRRGLTPAVSGMASLHSDRG